MNKTALLWLLPIAIVPQAQGLVNLGEGRIDLEVTGSVFYDTEIRARNLGQEDFVLTLSPSLIYTRPSKSLDLTAMVTLRGVAYLDYDEYNSTNLFFDLNVSPTAEMETAITSLLGEDVDCQENSAILKDEDRCIRCALCAQRCPVDAITMERVTCTTNWRMG